MIITDASGPADFSRRMRYDSRNGGQLAAPSEESLRGLDQFLPRHWSYNNPIEILGDADSERYAKAIEIAPRKIPTATVCW